MNAVRTFRAVRRLGLLVGLAVGTASVLAGCGQAHHQAATDRSQLWAQADTNNGKGTALKAMESDGSTTIDCTQLYDHEMATTYADAPAAETPDEQPFEAGCRQAVTERSAGEDPLSGLADTTPSPIPSPTPTLDDATFDRTCLDGTLVYISTGQPVRDDFEDPYGVLPPPTLADCQQSREDYEISTLPLSQTYRVDTTLTPSTP
jgi:hypothetical protein